MPGVCKSDTKMHALKISEASTQGLSPGTSPKLEKKQHEHTKFHGSRTSLHLISIGNLEKHQDNQ